MAADQYDSDVPRPVESILAELEHLLDELAHAAGPDALDGARAGLGAGLGAGSASRGAVEISRLVEVSARLRVAGTRMDAVRWSVLPRIEAAGLWAQSGARTFALWLARAEDVQAGTAKREVRTARALRDHLPATLTKALAGHISEDKVRALVEVATTSTERTQALGAPAVDLATIEPAPHEPAPDSTDTDGTDGALDGALDGADGVVPAVGSPTWEEQLLDWSRQNGPDRFRGLVRYFARHADPEADERGYVKAKDREYVDVSPTLGGYHLSGFLTEEHGQALTTAIGSVMGAPAAGDDRTPGQRRAQALADIARVVLDNAHTGTGASVRPHLSVTVSWSELQALAAKNQINDDRPSTATTISTAGAAGPGSAGANGRRRPGVPTIKTPAVFTETNHPVPASLLRRLACDSQITRIVFGPDSQILDVGRSQRTITGQLRRAVIARDKHCVLGQCDQPPSRCEVHHALRHWADGGETSASNAALLCWHHHDLVDSQGITMHYDNGWHFTDRDGHPIHTTSPST
ncbi:protein of unknown function (DUF222) [Promicromonospora umidemergens]|uniref:HNH endonuclease n=1 Tax=Promicromonospora umidemergens TaxID=629679 RepID=UPI0020A3AEFE|nr:HNH endonuclease signature motif containing protein [Promicromonospora umidemergens]MCP2282174.1 protein of unknown function (DUF222) [Promicromonospora umidemergens]